MKQIWQNLIEKLNSITINLDIQNENEFTFSGFNQTTVYGKIFKTEKKKLNRLILFYHGLGANTDTLGFKELAQMWTDNGYDVIGFDARNQGGKTKGYPELSLYGLYVSGIDDFEKYYYTNLYLDAYRLVEVAKIIFPNHLLIANGGSQGGALSLFAASHHPDIKICLADMPSNSDIPFLIKYTKSAFSAFSTFFMDHPESKDASMEILKKIDLLNHVKEITAPTLLASGTQDPVCPSRTAQSIFDRLNCKKEILFYEGYGHGGYDKLHFPKKIKWIEDHI